MPRAIPEPGPDNATAPSPVEPQDRPARIAAGESMALPLIVTAAAAVVYVLSSGPALGYYSARPVLWGTWHCAAVVNAYQPIEWAARQSAPVAHAVTSYRVYWHRFFLSTQAAVLPPSVPAVAARGAPQSGP